MPWNGQIIDLERFPAYKEALLDLEKSSLEINAQVHKVQLSAHSDSQQMIEKFKEINPKTIILVHGDEEDQEMFRKKIKAEKLKVENSSEVLLRKYPWLVKRQ